MLNTDLLERPIAGISQPDLDGTDPRLEEISGLALGGAYVQAARAVEALWETQIHDVRVLGYYLYGVFTERGLQGLPVVLRCLRMSLTESWEAFGPSRKKKQLADSALLWFVRLLLKQLEYLEKTKDPGWDAWRAPANHAALSAVQQTGRETLAALAATLGKARCLEPFQHLQHWLLQQEHAAAPPAPMFAPAAAPPRTSPAATPDQDGGPTSPEPAPGSPVAQEPAGPAGAPAPQAAGVYLRTPGPAATLIEGSAALHLLVKKVQAFEELIKKESFTRAALVASDIQTIVENFDPRVYFPRFFSTYFSLLSGSVENLEPCLQDRDSMTWKTLQQLYQVDLDAFLKI